ncbi:MAG: hypothetical protein K2N60_00185 [Oscillospiraceae bacterium]|nr:hypothetical protein [Ruminococcus sp.]MDE7301714.1 hypothetical protein [Oscillospiraceae bacterium]
MDIIVKNGTISDEEKNNYVRYLENKFPEKTLSRLEIGLDGDYVDLSYKFEDVPFERIRRVTGYLTGTLDRWNDAKRAEEHDRVKHGV